MSHNNNTPPQNLNSHNSAIHSSATSLDQQQQVPQQQQQQHKIENSSQTQRTTQHQRRHLNGAGAAGAGTGDDGEDDEVEEEEEEDDEEDGDERRIYGCDLCDRSFTRKHNLVTHRLVHSATKSFVCHICKSGFKRAHDLKRHVRMHTGEKPHVCPSCDRSFARADALLRHTKRGCRTSSVSGPSGTSDSVSRGALLSTSPRNNNKNTGTASLKKEMVTPQKRQMFAENMNNSRPNSISAAPLTKDPWADHHLQQHQQHRQSEPQLNPHPSHPSFHHQNSSTAAPMHAIPPQQHMPHPPQYAGQVHFQPTPQQQQQQQQHPRAHSHIAAFPDQSQQHGSVPTSLSPVEPLNSNNNSRALSLVIAPHATIPEHPAVQQQHNYHDASSQIIQSQHVNKIELLELKVKHLEKIVDNDEFKIRDLENRLQRLESLLLKESTGM